MKKQILAFLSHKNFHYLLIFLVSCVVAIPLIPLQLTNTHDGILHILRLIGTDLSLHYTDFPHLVIPLFCNDFGYSINAFYSPIATYLPYLFTNLPILYAEALKIFAYFTILLSGFTMYHCVLEITKKRPIALIASILYMVAPYRLADMYIRFALAEFTAFIFIPIVFQGIYNLLQGNQKKHFYITIGAAGLILTHAITAFYFAFFCLLYVLFHWKKLIQKEVLKKIGWNILFILGISAFHWIILLEYQSFLHYGIFDAKVMGTNREFVAQNTKSILEFFIPNGKLFNFYIGTFAILGLLASLFFLPRMIKRKEKEPLIFLILAIFSLFLCSCSFLWKLLPDALCKIQYSWRMLGEFIFFSSFVIAVNLGWIWEKVKDKKWQKILLIIIALAIFVVEVTMNLTQHWKNQKETEKSDLSYEIVMLNNLDFPISYINREYLPFQAIINREQILEREDKVLVIEGEVNITSQEKEMTNLTAKIENGKKDTKLELPYFYYPGYVVTLITEEGTIELKQEESELGMICVTLPEDIAEGEIQLSYQGTTLEKIAYLISAISFILFLCMIIWQAKKEEKGKEDKEKV